MSEIRSSAPREDLLLDALIDMTAERDRAVEGQKIAEEKAAYAENAWLSALENCEEAGKLL